MPIYFFASNEVMYSDPTCVSGLLNNKGERFFVFMRCLGFAQKREASGNAFRSVSNQESEKYDSLLVGKRILRVAREVISRKFLN